MEQFKPVLQRRLIALSAYIAGLMLLAVMGLIRPTAGETEEVRAFISGLNAGLFTVVVIAAAKQLLRYAAALKDEEKRKALYIYENDERRLYIQSKMGGAAIQWILSGLVAAAFVAEFFNQTVFFTLLGALLFAAAVKAVFKMIYTGRLS